MKLDPLESGIGYSRLWQLSLLWDCDGADSTVFLKKKTGCFQTWPRATRNDQIDPQSDKMEVTAELILPM